MEPPSNTWGDGTDSAIAHYSACVFGTPPHSGRPGRGLAVRSTGCEKLEYNRVVASRGGHPKRRAGLMIRARRFIFVAIGFSLFAASACGGGGDELEKALQSLSEDDLATMVLPQEEYGEASKDLEIDPQSGFEDSDEAANDTLDPEDTGDDLKEAGFVTSYSLRFEDPAFSALEEGKGILDVSSTVDLFEDEAAAAAYLAKQLGDYRRFEGEEVEPGTTLEEVEEFVVEGIADDATGLVLHVSFADSDIYATGVVFTVGRLRAGTGITEADDRDVTADAQRIGRALAERIEGG